MPELDQDYCDKIDTCQKPFEGNPESNIFKAEAPQNPAPTEPLDSDDEQPKPPPKDFNEIDRLTYVVHAIEVDCQVVPVGAFKLTQNHEMNYNSSFPGLTVEQANSLDHYQHFRNANT